jgi:hypothetical protein
LKFKGKIGATYDSSSLEIDVILTTILSICILRKYYSTSKDEWSMMAKKAEAFLKTHKVTNYRDLISKAMALL